MADLGEINIGDLSSMVEKLKNNPEIVSSVVSALGMPMPDITDKPQNGEDKTPSSLPDVISTIAPMLSSKPTGDKDGRGADHLTALLCALRPYLNPERQEIIDYIMKFSRIGDLLKKLQ